MYLQMYDFAFWGYMEVRSLILSQYSITCFFVHF